MAEEFKQRPNSGALFTNKDKKTEKQPDFKGRILIGSDLLDAIRNGDELEISGWKRETQYGKTWLSLSVGKVYRKPESLPTPSPRTVDEEESPF
jgi:hypothetical protein